MKLVYKFALILLCLIFLITGCAQQTKNENDKKAASTPTAPQLHQVTSPKAGKIIGLIVEKGERISQEQPLFAYADEALDKEIDKAIADVTAAEAKLKVMEKGTPASSGASLATLKARQQAAEQKATKMQRLLAVGGISRVQAEAAQRELQQANQALYAAQNGSSQPASKEKLEEQKQIIQQLTKHKEELLNKRQASEVLCPATGTIKEVKVQNGAEVKENQLILVIEADSTNK